MLKSNVELILVMTVNLSFAKELYFLKLVQQNFQNVCSNDQMNKM